MLENIALYIIYFLVPEIILPILISKTKAGYKFRFSMEKLNPLISYTTVAGAILLIAFITPIIEFLTKGFITNWLLSLGLWKLIVVVIGLILFALFYLTYAVLRKKPDKKAVIIIISLIMLAIIFFVLWIWLEFSNSFI